MKKLLIMAISLVSILIVFCSCSKNQHVISSDTVASSMSSIDNKESRGVPESLVLRNITIPENVTYEIIHKYDSATHIDDVELITSYTGKFGTKTQKYVYSYQYDKSTDLWTLMSGNNGLQSDITVFDENKYLNNEFTGKFNGAHSGKYRIIINEIDFDKKKVAVEYLLIFDDTSDVLTNTKSFDICNTTTDKLCFAIPYKRSMVVSFEQLFIFDIDNGFCA